MSNPDSSITLESLAEDFLGCVQHLLGQCDGAVTEDGIGFNKPDAGWARKRCGVPAHVWTYDEVCDAASRLRKYRKQLSSLGVDFSSIPQLPAIDQAGTEWSAWATDRIKKRQAWTKAQQEELLKEASTICWLPKYGLFHLSFPAKRHDAREALKANVPGRRWDASRYVWTVPPSSGKALVEFLVAFPFATPGEDTQRKLAEVSQNCPPADGVELSEGRFVVRFSYNPAAIAAVKEIPGRKWDQNTKRWTVPCSEDAAAALRSFCTAFDLTLSPEAESALGGVCEASEANLAASSAEAAEIEIPGLGGDLRPFQKAGVAYVAKARNCILGDDMGLGKTIQALASAQYLQAFPLVVVCPASLKRNWERETQKWLPGKTVEVVHGRAGAIFGADVIVINYDIVKPRLDQLLAIQPRGVIFDESHALKNSKAQRTRACSKLAENRDLVLEMTGTPVLNRPSELISQLKILGKLDDFGGFWHFATRYCGAYKSRFGLQWGTPRHLDELAEKLRRNCFVRREKSEVLPELPAKQRSVVSIDLADREYYEHVAADTSRWLADRAIEDEAFLESIAHLPGDERRNEIAQHRKTAEFRARQAEQLTRIEALKQAAAEQKAPAVIEWIETFLESDQKLVVFAHHKSVQQQLINAFPGCLSILGEDDSTARDAAVQSFQNDDSKKLIVCSLQAAGVGLTLTAASNVAFVELGWTPAIHDQAEDRCHRIGQHDSVNAYYLLAEGTIDDDIWALIESKRGVAGTITAKITVEDVLRRIATEAPA